MIRRDFLHRGTVAAGILGIHPWGRRLGDWVGALTPIPTADKKRLADVALEAARSAGASYTDVRIGRYLNESLSARETNIQSITTSESYGAGIRVIADGTWGFAATNDVTEDGMAAAARQAAAMAKANAPLQSEPVRLAPQRGFGEVSWRTPIETNAFEVPIGEKVDLLLETNNAALSAGASYISSALYFVNEQKYFASSDGSYIDQDVHRLRPGFTVTVVDPESGRFETRESLSSPMGMGYEYLSGRASGKIAGPATTVYGQYYDMIEDARNAAVEARAKHDATSVAAGTYDLVLDPSHLWLTIHESVGHPLELDRVLGYEANYAGTSFASLDKWRSESFQYGSPIVNFVADKTQATSLAAVGYDDEGVQTKQWDLVRNGILVNYQATRDQVHVLGEAEGQGCSFADHWSTIQFQRMPNVSLEPGTVPLTVAEMIAGVEKGIYILGDGSYSIDQQRYNFQFGGQLFYEIRNGRIAGMLKDVAYQANTQTFWNSCSRICDQRDYRLGGSFFDGKGQPGQVSAVSHGTSTARFDAVNVLNTARKV
ncbi:MAG: TldD/PmbA family protein [Gemmatimonadales bacterium]|nr:MAG: TldD/PmbA family protein [Gemmatimonadales bacterium]